MWRSIVITLFPEMFPGLLGFGLNGQALKNKLWSLRTVNIRDHGINAHNSVDDTPFGGGPGMVLRPDVIDAAVRTAKMSYESLPVLVMSPKGRPLAQDRIKELAFGEGVILLCGRYEGIDQRAIEEHAMEEVSIGDFILSGGEPAALAILDACVRTLPGVIGKNESLEDESFENGLLEYPQYTRPQVWMDRSVPEVLISGHHKKIKSWRLAQAEALTQRRRPDLWEMYLRENC
ncbi:MAG: tRNA (guanosine(37)-N1)-methyltransferase TrmD [Magnetovibrio sp.]|nr:tRNA (guanosine(37)-N1)-methyltransferase TrmD [Magnetovibrio sp.]